MLFALDKLPRCARVLLAATAMLSAMVAAMVFAWILGFAGA
jgi:hypothetical protein